MQPPRPDIDPLDPSSLLDGIGIDSWAVDHGLLDETGALLGETLRRIRQFGKVARRFRLLRLRQRFGEHALLVGLRLRHR